MKKIVKYFICGLIFANVAGVIISTIMLREKQNVFYTFMIFICVFQIILYIDLLIHKFAIRVNNPQKPCAARVSNK